MVMLAGPKPRILACIPSYSGVEPLPFIRFMMLAQQTGQAEEQHKYQVRWMLGGPRAKIVPVRNTAAKTALELGCSHLFMADDDMILPDGIIERLLAHDLDIVAPLFYREGGDPLVFTLTDGKPTHYRDHPKGALFEAPGGVGTGVILIKTKVLKAMPQPYFSLPADTRYGEDIDFCGRARELGFITWCDSSIIVPQMGPRTVILGPAD